MKITKDIEQQIILADKTLKRNGYIGYKWKAWLKGGIANEWFPWCCDSEYEAAGWQMLEAILIATGNKEKIKKFRFEEDYIEMENP